VTHAARQPVDFRCVAQLPCLPSSASKLPGPLEAIGWKTLKVRFTLAGRRAFASASAFSRISVRICICIIVTATSVSVALFHRERAPGASVWVICWTRTKASSRRRHSRPRNASSKSQS
jgi:hypothetical protein